MKRVDGVSKLFDVKNRNIVITGSSGLLGSQYANTLSEAGANVILVDLESKKNKKLENSLVKKYGNKAHSYTSDISNLQEVKKLSKNVLRDFKRIDGLIIAPVDTTLAIYRTDLFITNKFKMLPGHASLIKPYYYVCRTKNIYLAQHLGWKNYDNPVKEQLRDKIICFTKYAGYIDSNILKETDIRTRAFHKFFKYFCKSFWAMLVLFYWAKYIASRFPRKWNEIQSRYR